MKNINLVFLAAVVLWSAGCTPPAKETFRMAPEVPPDGGVEIVKARGYDVAVSHKDHSDVSVFGIVHENVMVVWLRYENYFDRAVEIDPGRISLAAADKKGKSKNLTVFSQEQKGSGEAFKSLESGLAGVYLFLTGDAGPTDTKLAAVKKLWQEHAGEYQSLRQILLKKTPIQTNESLEGYIIAPYTPGERFTLSVPLHAETHRFELVPAGKARKPSA